MKRRIHVCLAAAVVGAIVVGIAASASSSSNPRLLVLRLNDLPVGFSASGGHYASNLRASKESLGISVAQYLRWGRILGYEATFNRQALVGLVQVVSAANTYKSIRGAADSLHASFRLAARPNKSGYRYQRLSSGGPIGNESRLYKVRTTVSGTKLDLYLLAWRYLTVTAAVTGGGAADRVTPGSVVALAKKQQQRIAAALR